MGAPKQSSIAIADVPRAPIILKAALSLIGFSAIVGQIVLMRELIVVFYGNEMALGLMLAAWLLWTALGSSVLGRLSGRMRNPRTLVALLQILISIALPATIWGVRASRGFFQTVPGELLGPGPALITALATLSIFCSLSGWLFAAGSRLHAAETHSSTDAATGSVYLLESTGSAIGGVIASLLLIRFLEPFQIAFLVALLNLSVALLLIVQPFRVRLVALTALIVVFVGLAIPFGSSVLESRSLARLWQGFHLTATKDSIYGKLAVVETEGARTLYENGLVMFSAPDPSTAEESVHLALLQHPAPKTLLLIGGGVNGSIAEALQHPTITRIDYVELDPAILSVARKYFPEQWSSIAADSRVNIHTADGRLFLTTSNRKYDVIIVNSPDPQTAQLNRFYTLEFFREARERLEPRGLLSFQLRASENYISPVLAEFLRCINATLRESFTEVAAIPGETVHFFAATQSGTLTTDPLQLVQRIQSRHLHTIYIREYYLPFRMTPDRMADLTQQLRPDRDTRINRDFSPIAYYFNVALWSTQFNAMYRHWFMAAARFPFGRLLLIVVLALFATTTALLYWRSRQYIGGASTAAFSVALMGFTLIALEVLLLLGFQAIYGYVYHRLALITGAFMAGMAGGSWWSLRAGNSVSTRALKQQLWLLAFVQVLAAFCPLLLYGLLKTGPLVFGTVLFSVAVVPLLSCACGALGGYQFPLASRIFFRNSRNAANTGALYALDLAGACIGAMLLSAYFVPVFGFFDTGLLIAVANLAPASLAFLVAYRNPSE